VLTGELRGRKVENLRGPNALSQLLAQSPHSERSQMSSNPSHRTATPRSNADNLADTRPQHHQLFLEPHYTVELASVDDYEEEDPVPAPRRPAFRRGRDAAPGRR
jgi:hypothetical protein